MALCMTISTLYFIFYRCVLSDFLHSFIYFNVLLPRTPYAVGVNIAIDPLMKIIHDKQVKLGCIATPTSKPQVHLVIPETEVLITSQEKDLVKEKIGMK